MKKLQNIDSKILIIIALFLIIVSFFFTRYIINSSNSKAQQNKSNNFIKGQQNESEVMGTVDGITRNYLAEKYAQSTINIVRQEYVGEGYAIVDATFTVDSQKNNRKIYLQYNESAWTVLYDGEKKISCEKVRELISVENILQKFCE